MCWVHNIRNIVVYTHTKYTITHTMGLRIRSFLHKYVYTYCTLHLNKTKKKTKKPNRQIRVIKERYNWHRFFVYPYRDCLFVEFIIFVVDKSDRVGFVQHCKLSGSWLSLSDARLVRGMTGCDCSGWLTNGGMWYVFVCLLFLFLFGFYVPNLS